MKRLHLIGLCAAIALATSAPSGLAQTKKHLSTPPVKGAPQLPGDNGKLEQAYTMGLERPVNFALHSAEYTLGRLVVGDNFYTPTREQKLLLLKFSVQNPNKFDTLFRFDTLKLMAVDSKDVNHEWVGDSAHIGEKQEAIDLNLKPGQKMEGVTGIMVPVDASVPKLMVQHVTGGKVLRYDLHGVIKPLTAPFADSADKTGATAIVDIPATKDVFFAMEAFDVKYVSSVLTPDKLGDCTPSEGGQLLVVTLTLRNPTTARRFYRSDTLRVRLLTADGEKVDKTQNIMLKTTRNETAEGNLEPNESYTCRLVIDISKGEKPAKLMLGIGESHPYLFDISDVK